MSHPTVYICNAFSLSMLVRDDQRGTPCGYDPQHIHQQGACARIPRPVDSRQVIDIIEDAMADGVDIASAVGHPDTAALLSSMLGIALPPNRITIRLERTDQQALVAQVVRQDGTPYRLDPGTTTLPADATIEWWLI